MFAYRNRVVLLLIVTAGRALAKLGLALRSSDSLVTKSSFPFKMLSGLRYNLNSNTR